MVGQHFIKENSKFRPQRPESDYERWQRYRDESFILPEQPQYEPPVTDLPYDAEQKPYASQDITALDSLKSEKTSPRDQKHHHITPHGYLIYGSSPTHAKLTPALKNSSQMIPSSSVAFLVAVFIVLCVARSYLRRRSREKKVLV